MQIIKVVPFFLSLLVVAACGGGGDDPSDGSAATPRTTVANAATEGSAWSFGDDDGPSTDDLEGTPATSDGPADGEALPAIPINDFEGSPPDGKEHPAFDPCSLLGVEEWASWRRVPPDEASKYPLEQGEACGYRSVEDSIRVAFAVLETSGGVSSWLPDDTVSEDVQVGQAPARWVRRYPIPESSVLVVDLGEAELVLEMSSRGSADDAMLREGAIELATRAAERYAP